MSKNFPKFPLLLVLASLLLFNAAPAQTPLSCKDAHWSQSPFEHKVFIENKGQFKGSDLLENSDIRYGVENKGMNVYFTPSGLSYRFDKIEKKQGKAEEGLEDKGEERENMELVPDAVHIQWLNSDPNVRIKVGEKVPQYYNYSLGKDHLNDINRVNGYSKMVYEGLYPGIDVEYTFPDKGGIKYTFIVQPNADPSQIKMKYSSADFIRLDREGNLHLGTRSGDLIDHAPISFFEDGEPVRSSFKLEGDVITFSIDLTPTQKSKVKNQKLIIDPWTINPNLTTQNRAFDVEHDGAGNVYVFGGLGPFKLQKYTPAGALIWALNTPYTGAYYGDLAVTQSGIAYITAGHNGCGALPSITKVSSAGAIIWNNTIASCMEFWCISSNCAGTSIVSGDSFSPSGGRLSNIDTTNGNRVGSVQLTTGGKDFRAMCIGPNANFYVLTTDYGPPHNLVAATPAFTVIYNITSGHSAGYGGTPLYANGNIAGFNGITSNCRYIYHFDGIQLWKRNITTGAQVGNIPSVPSGLKDGCNAVAVDGCGNVFVGTTNSVLKYDSNLTLLTTTATTGAVYDITMGMNGEVLVAGNGFLSSLAISTASCQTINVVTTNATCSNPGTASVVLGATACPGAYTYSWTPGGWTTQNVTGLTAGTYTVNIKTPNGCGVNNTNHTVSISGGGGASLTLNTSQVNATCAQLGSASVTATGGTGTLTYSWSPTGQATQNATGLSAGNYTVTVTDQTGCSGTKSLSITQAGGTITAGINAQNILCNGGTGTATASGSGGTGPYTYSWSNGQNVAGATGLSAGTYTVLATDANGCTQTATVTITQPPVLNVNSSATLATCGSSNGTASVTGSGGTGSYTYSWSSGAQTTQTATGLAAGTYTVTVRDANGCSKTISATVNNAGSPVVGITTSVNVTCFGGNNGSATATASGGTGTLTYSWSPSGGATLNATGLTAGTYTITVTDGNGCSVNTTVSITQPTAVAAGISASANVTCNGGNNGSATVTASGGTGTLTYSWSNSQNTATATGLIAGGYTVTVTDANGCSRTAAVTITQPTAITLNTSATIASCGTSNGSASVTASGGTGAFTYSWSSGAQTTQTATGLAAATYTVLVTDANGCTQTATAAVTNAGAPTASMNASTNVSCFNGTNGSATASVTGGTGTLTYSWAPNGGNALTGSNLAAGTYTFTVTDGNGCTSTATVAITQPTQLTVNATGSTVCQGTAATATCTAGGGTTGYNYLWSDGQTTSTATGLTTGGYTITITDANNCTATATAQVTVNPLPVVTITADDTAGCAPLCVNFDCTTANIASWSWDFGDITSGGSNTSSLKNPSHCFKNPGNYNITVTVTDNNGCTASITKTAWINVYPNVTADFLFSPQPTTVLNPTITFTDISTGANTWNWNFGETGSTNNTSTLQNPVHTYKDSGCYNVELIADNQYNCPDTAEHLVCIMGDYELYAPNAFTPDGNGLNDNWNVKGVGIDPNYFEMYIFDRWGNLIYKTTDLYEGWNGKANGGREIAQQDVYVWKVFTRDFLGGKHSYIGHVSLVR